MFSQHPFTPWTLPSKVTIGESEFSNMRTQECNHDKLLCKNKNLQDQPLFFKMWGLIQWKNSCVSDKDLKELIVSVNEGK